MKNFHQFRFSLKTILNYVEAVKLGSCNLKAHIDNLKSFGIPIVVTLNKYVEDTEKEIEVVKNLCKSLY